MSHLNLDEYFSQGSEHFPEGIDLNVALALLNTKGVSVS